MDGPLDQRREAAIRRRQTARLAAIAVLVALAVALAVDNGQDVAIGWLLGETDAPLAVALVVAFLLGLAVGWLSGRRQRT